MVISVFHNSLGICLALFCLFQTVEASSGGLIESKSKIEEVRRSLLEISQELQKLKTMTAGLISSSSNFSASTQTKLSPPKKIRYREQEFSSTHTKSSLRKEGGFDPSGFYILPFLGLLTSENLSWESPFFGEFEIEEGVGTSTGLSIGYEGRNFFSDFQVSYIQNRMKSIKLPFPVPFPLSFSGKSKALGFHVTGGGRFHLNQYISASIGAGIGGVNQDISFLLGGLPQEEKSFLFSYQLFSGLELHPSKYTKVGFRYRWLNIEEMESFSSRDLHLLEMYLGYLF